MTPQDPRRQAEALAAGLRARADQAGEARRRWALRAQALVPYVERVVAPLADYGHPPVFVQTRDVALWVYFGDHLLRTTFDGQTARGYFAIGAQAVFAFCPDGRVRGFRCPSFREGSPRPDLEVFSDLGQPDGISDEAMGAAVVAFLTWATEGPA
jgi:hypothetical protein